MTLQNLIKNVPEGRLSTIVIPDEHGITIETILFDHDGNGIGPTQRSYIGLRSVADEHYKTIREAG